MPNSEVFVPRVCSICDYVARPVGEGWETIEYDIQATSDQRVDRFQSAIDKLNDAFPGCGCVHGVRVTLRFKRSQRAYIGKHARSLIQANLAVPFTIIGDLLLRGESCFTGTHIRGVEYRITTD